ncbi:MAG: N(4)-(beta-N-acetylglucosaminyl)-L-asparaginase [Bacteroidetes bacterium]|nr:N(4)-(beta-N-acetylglucosaminyl)-L-asparaginase [Bacteroidota bacterium]
MFSRKDFIIKSTLAAGAGTIGLEALAATENKTTMKTKPPLIIATWKNLKATEAGWLSLQKGGSSLDAVEAGAMVPEADPADMSVGYGGLPDRDGKVTLDACIMDYKGNAGSVAFLENIMHPISVARKVMEKTPHVMLSGDGAFQFAIENGFKKENLLIDKAKEKWLEWKKESKYEPVINIELHDTIGVLAIDANNHIAGACTTSGLAYKVHGRVGDSPIIGAGMYVDDEVGGACATGVGELVMKTLGSFLIVELMRQGMTPQQACEEAIRRIVKKYDCSKSQATSPSTKKGDIGAYSIQTGFMYSLYAENENRIVEVEKHID